MSFEELKARLVGELDETQAKIRADFGMKPRPAQSTGDALADAKANKPGTGKRSSKG